ncbi:hypothetical protein KOW79_018564 [Hemibagrus wyckioides]|uniref:Uncharacterized protein n=1 Tax=Hemibagrus wyckioides TaxID=337641 RepID=A0A9D3N7V4_9TELE|nr:hypothetical protein KOW79_018564 [Hemibagrus wyckioides]
MKGINFHWKLEHVFLHHRGPKTPLSASSVSSTPVLRVPGETLPVVGPLKSRASPPHTGHPGRDSPGHTVVLRRGRHVSTSQAHGVAFPQTQQVAESAVSSVQSFSATSVGTMPDLPSVSSATLCPPLPSLDRVFRNVPSPAIPTACWRRVPCASPPTVINGSPRTSACPVEDAGTLTHTSTAFLIGVPAAAAAACSYLPELCHRVCLLPGKTRECCGI